MDGISYTLQWAAPSSPHNCPFLWRDLDFNTWFLGFTRVRNPKGIILIGSAVFAGLTIVTDRQTDRPRYSACNNAASTYVLRCGLKSVPRVFVHFYVAVRKFVDIDGILCILATVCFASVVCRCCCCAHFTHPYFHMHGCFLSRAPNVAK